MTVSAHRRKVLSIVLAVSALLLFAAFATLNAWDPKFLAPDTSGLIFVYTAISAMAFLVFLGVMVMLVRNVLKLYADQRSRLMGTRLRTRMLFGAVLVSLVPISFMFFFSYLLLNRAVDRWFAQPVTQMRDDSNHLALELSRYTTANARFEAEAIAASLPGSGKGKEQAAGAGIRRVLREHEITLQGGFAVVFRDEHAIAAYHLPRPGTAGASVKGWLPDAARSRHDPLQNAESAAAVDEDSPAGTGVSQTHDEADTTLLDASDDAILAAARRTEEAVYRRGKTEFSLGMATVLKDHGTPVNVVVGLPLPVGMSATVARLRTAADSYWQLFRGRREVRNSYMLLLVMITSLAMFACIWLALWLSKQVTRPVEALGDAMASIAAGDYAHRVGASATEELGDLVRSFNHMAEDLEGSRAQVEASTALLSAANSALEARSGELETMLETIPNGVATLDPGRRIVAANRALSELFDPGGQRRFLGHTIEEVFPAEILEALDRLLRRSHRMGSAASEMEMGSGASTINLLATVALLERGTDHQHFGYVLVLENATELLRAQKQSAWKEVARRVAHEIKNPLTPISLSAEQIARHIDRLEQALSAAHAASPSVAVIRRCSQVISSSVESMRGLVDQFAALAQFPTAKPVPSDLNTIVENSLAIFQGRMQGVRLKRQLAPGLPLVMADPESMKRALGNLIDNALEAMQGSLLREIRITTGLLATGMVELTLADTGTGLNDEMRERLFLPYFSTKQRGTGLGLAIAAKVIQEHEGTIRAEKNTPAGALFIVELKPASTDTLPTDTLPTDTEQRHSQAHDPHAPEHPERDLVALRGDA